MSSELGIDVFLAVLEKEEIYDVQDEYDLYCRQCEERSDEDEDEDEEEMSSDWRDLVDTSYKFKRLVALNGRQLLTHASTNHQEFKDGVLQQVDIFEDAEQEEETSYMGK